MAEESLQQAVEIANEKNSRDVSIDKLIANMEQVIKGHHEQIIQVITCLIAGGHILLEDNPGAGKTVMAKTLAHSISEEKTNLNAHAAAHANFNRIQFTPDLLPMDLLGTHIYDEEAKDFIFKKGPLFTNVLLTDEINRASPKVQSALLECMAEHQITMGDQTYPLEKPFFVIATQNPIEMEGTYPLPNAQLDRFFMKISFGYVAEEVEFEIYRKYLEISNFESTTETVLSLGDVLSLQEEAHKIFIHDEIVRGVNNLIRATRNNQGISLGASVRSGIILLKCLKAYAMINKRSYVIEDDLTQLVYPVLHHRLLFRNKSAEAEALNSMVKSEVKRLARLKLSFDAAK
ncbi:MAG: AAA family ATPase [Bacteroidota bacterium]